LPISSRLEIIHGEQAGTQLQMGPALTTMQPAIAATRARARGARK
jgi:hypothetical protein